MCRFGVRCTRKNPAHYDEENHPDDHPLFLPPPSSASTADLTGRKRPAPRTPLQAPERATDSSASDVTGDAPAPPAAAAQAASRLPPSVAEASADAEADRGVAPTSLPTPLPASYSREAWRPVLREAFLSPFADDVFALSANERLSSRFVNASYELRHGPFRRRQLPGLKTPGWTVLVQQTNAVWPASEAFLDTFRFIPSCRLDDLMVSLASDQGGIGAHVDSYDVFLIQAYGCRRWEVAETFQPDIQDGLDLKILKRFKPEAIYDMHPGDLLYLPPGVAHRGTAQGTNCITYSVGFRAANRLEIADESFMAHLSGLSDSAWTRMQLPGPLSGMGLVLPLQNGSRSCAKALEDHSKRKL